MNLVKEVGTASKAMADAPEAPKNAGKLLVPLALIGAIAASAYLIMNPGEKPANSPAGGATKPASVQPADSVAPPAKAEVGGTPTDSKANEK